MDKGLEEATRRFGEREWLAAIEALSSVEANEDNQSDIAYLLGLSHARLSHWDEALLYLEQVVTADPDPARVSQCRLVLAYVYTMTGRHRLAEYEMGQLASSDRYEIQVDEFMAYSAWAQDRIDEAIAWYEKALALDPENPTALNGIGYLLACAGRDSAKAITYCRKAVDKRPDNPAYLDSLAWAYYRLGFLEEARQYLSRALAAAPHEAEILEHARALERDR